ncbi:MAG: DUF1549 domain-containing protein [Planctomycetes bacterium]|nr:DUF1549 domain-containing protein [Planctomycetota bacterium]
MSRIAISCMAFCLLNITARAHVPVGEIQVDPVKLRLAGPDARYSLLIHGKSAAGQLMDLTGEAKFTALQPKIARVDAAGVVSAVADGTAAIQIDVRGQKKLVTVEVVETARARAAHFENDVIPVLSRFGCNSSGCHGGAEGQNGFKLSVFGSDPTADIVALTKESRGRRVLYSAPDNSLLLLKATGAAPHGGGARLPRASREYDILRAWIAAGARPGDPAAPHVTGLRIEPAERIMDMKSQQQLRVIARYSDDREIDVTSLARFQTNNEGLGSVSLEGRVTAGQAPGEVAVMASFLGEVAVFRAMIPRAEKIASYPALIENNFIDGLVFRRLKKLNIVPSDTCDDADFLRRAYLDVIGTLPTAAEARAFLADRRADRRQRLVDELLRRPEFVDYWALKWSDLLRVDRQALGHKAAYAYYRWIRDSIAADKPLDKMARELVTADGPIVENAAANFYRVVQKPGERASTLSQVFLGVRIACAECHHHPFDRWSQDDYYGMQAFFNPLQIGRSGQGDFLSASGDAKARNPRSGQTITAQPLGANAAEQKVNDARLLLADWLTAPDNPWFARNLANRAWAHFTGRGLVEPVDDVRATNPPSNPELLDALARKLIDSRFDFKQLVRAITASRVYQLSAKPNATNARDEFNSSRALFRRLDAEVLLDMVSQTTGVAERFKGVPPGQRAIQLWDSKVPHYFLKLFGRPIRVTACECERNHEPGVSQVLHLLNSPQIQAKLAHATGTVNRLARRHQDNAELVDELYLTFLSRYPSADEQATAKRFLEQHGERRRQAAEDLAWSLMNTLEFPFNH